MSKSITELEALRKTLKNKITEKSFVWKTVCLQSIYAGLSNSFGFIPIPIVTSVFVEVCEVVRVNHEGKDFYFPARADETREFAKTFNAFPLTRAVADQLYNQAGTHLSIHPQSPPFKPKTEDPTKDPVYMKAHGEKLKDFEEQSDYLGKNNYKGIEDFGAHKLWVLSKFKVGQCAKPEKKNTAACKADKFTVNYGMYRDKLSSDKPGKNEGGPILKDYNPGKRLEQPLGATHDFGHWDYSQLLQLMRDSSPIPFRDEAGFITYMDLKTALLNGHPLLWDESQPKLSSGDLQF